MIVESFLYPDETFEVIFDRIKKDYKIKNICSYKILKKSIDARKKRGVKIFYRLEIEIGDCTKIVEKRIKILSPEELFVVENTRKSNLSPIVIGTGPSSIFAALVFVANGVKPLIIERGQWIEQRVKDVWNFKYKRILDENSNVVVGEGGAGTFSDGKLFTRKRNFSEVLHVFAYFDAPYEILYQSRPHIGSNLLIKVQKKIRSFLLERGARFIMGKRVEKLLINGGKVDGVVTFDGEKIYGNAVVCGAGNSAFSLYKNLYSQKVLMEFKPFAIGFRVEHKREHIDFIQYGRFAKFKTLSSANYELRYHEKGKGVYSFCMCPGGYVIPSQGETDTVVVNGMSNSARRGEFSNSAIVIEINEKDVYDFLKSKNFEYKDTPLKGFVFQRYFEQMAFRWGGGNYDAPAQTLTDFLSGKNSGRKIKTSFKPGVKIVPLFEFFPKNFVLIFKNAFRFFDKKMKGFITNEALLIAPETKTSSPVRVLRNEVGESISVKGFFPIGEGSGYSGGITSSAMDGIKVAKNILMQA